MKRAVTAMVNRSIEICAQITCHVFQLGVAAVRSTLSGQHAAVLHPEAEDRNHEPEDKNPVKNALTGSHDDREAT